MERVSHGKRSASSRRQSFVTVAYVERGSRLRPEIKPQACPRAEAGEVCQVSWQGGRRRATGAVRWLQKARCVQHGGFSVYPPGQVPYGRRSVAAVGVGGQPVAVEAGVAPSEAWREGLPGGGAGCRGGPAVGA